ncbi:MAG: hypothetical protein ACXWVS_08525, partial [Hyphomicrobium sp.]
VCVYMTTFLAARHPPSERIALAQAGLQAKHRLTGYTSALVGAGRNAALMPLYALFDEEVKQESSL